MAEQVAEALERLAGAAPASGSATTRTRCSCPCAPARASRCPGCSTRSSTSGLNDDVGRGARAGDRERALRLGLLPALRADVRQRLARHRRRAVRGRDQGGQVRPRRQGRHRARRRRAEGAHGEASRSSTTSRRTRRSSCARRSARCSTPGPASAPSTTGASTASPTSGAPRSTCSRWSSATRATTSGTGVAFSRDEVTGAPEPSGDFLVNAQGEDVVSGVRNTRDIAEHGGRHAGGARAADGDPAHAREALQGHAGHRVHGRGRAAVHAPDAQRQASGAGGGALRLRRRRRGAADQGGGARDDRPELARRAAAPDVRPQGRVRGAGERASTRRRARPRARSCSRPPTRWPRATRGAT